jgi:alpha-L-fucosidase
MLVYPYAEGYWNAVKDSGSPSAQYHKEKYGDMSYRGFRQMFIDGLEKWDPKEWAETFKTAGAKYVVLTAKHHDGFCLWPTKVENENEKDWFSRRDIVGELADAVREKGLKFGLYYSGGIDWTFNRRIVRTFMEYTFSTPGGKYPDYADAQIRELINRYQPDILWNDICWPGNQENLFDLFAYYYNMVPDGVINDRWNINDPNLNSEPMLAYMDNMVKDLIKSNTDIYSTLAKPEIPHCDFFTPEYTQYSAVQQKKWEMTRGIGNSFGYNRNEETGGYASFEDLFASFIDAVSKNGNLLLNVGPRGEDSTIPAQQTGRLIDFGKWLNQNGEAVYGSSPYTQAEAMTDTGTAVRFTQKGDKVYLIILEKLKTNSIHIKNIWIKGTAALLNDHSPVTIKRKNNDMVIVFDDTAVNTFAPVVCFDDKTTDQGTDPYKGETQNKVNNK